MFETKDFNITELIEEKLDSITTAEKEDSLKVNNHIKLLSLYLDVDAIFRDLVEVGFKGKRNDLNDFIECLLYGLDATDAFTNGDEITEEEYLKALVEQMNSVVT